MSTIPEISNQKDSENSGKILRKQCHCKYIPLLASQVKFYFAIKNLEISHEVSKNLMKLQNLVAITSKSLVIHRNNKKW